MSLRILFADDYPGIASCLRDTAKARGHTAESVLTAEEAVEKIRNNKYNLAFLDHDFGYGMNGSEAVIQIRTFSDIPLYVLCAGLDEQAQAKTSGATDSLDKLSPNLINEIRNVISQYDKQ